MMNDKDWKWDGVIINGFAKFNRLIRQDCQRERVTGALDEPPGQPEPAGPTEQIFAGNPSGLYTAKTKHDELIKRRKDEFEQVIAIITARLDTVPAQRVDSISSSDTILPKNKIALILQKLEEDFAGDNIVNKTKIEKQMNSLPNGTDATSIEILLNQLTTLNSALYTMHASYAWPPSELIATLLKKITSKDYSNLKDQLIDATITNPDYTWIACCKRVRRTIEMKSAFHSDDSIDYSAGSASRQPTYEAEQAERDRKYGEQVRLAASASEYGRPDRDTPDSYERRDRGRRDRSNSESRFRGRSGDRRDNDKQWRGRSRDRERSRSMDSSPRSRSQDRNEYGRRNETRRRYEDQREDYREDHHRAKDRYESKRANSARSTRPDSPYVPKAAASSSDSCW